MLADFFTNLYYILRIVSIPVLFGLVFSTLVELLAPRDFLTKYFKKTGLSSIIVSALLGTVLGAFSAGAVVIIAALRKKGVSVTNCLTMLSSTAWSGLMNFFIISSYVGIVNSLILIASSILLSFILGLLFYTFEKYKLLDMVKPEHIKLAEYSNGEPLLKPEKSGFQAVFLRAVKSFGLLILINLLLAALLRSVIPPTAVTSLLSNDYSILYITPIASILEVYGEGFGILAGELYYLGASLGVVFVLLIAGVTIDINELFMINKIFGKKTMLYYLVTSTVLLVIFGLSINVIF